MTLRASVFSILQIFHTAWNAAAQPGKEEQESETKHDTHPKPDSPPISEAHLSKTIVIAIVALHLL